MTADDDDDEDVLFETTTRPPPPRQVRPSRPPAADFEGGGLRQVPAGSMEMTRTPRPGAPVRRATPAPEAGPPPDVTEPSQTTAAPATTEAPDPDAEVCSGRPFDSFMQVKNGSIFAFRGESRLPAFPDAPGRSLTSLFLRL